MTNTLRFFEGLYLRFSDLNEGGRNIVKV